MGRLRNSTNKNTFGGGYEQIYTDDNGNEYTIKNSPYKNTFGDGCEKEIVKTKSGDSEGKLEDVIPWWLTVIIIVICIIIQLCMKD